MMFRITLLAIVLVVSGCTNVWDGVSLAARANAAIDSDEYIQWLDRTGVSYTSQQDAINSGFVMCGKLRDSQRFSSVGLEDVSDSDVFGNASPHDVAEVVESVIFALCPDAAEGLIDQAMEEDPGWNGDDPDRAQRRLDAVCAFDPHRRGCNNVPESVTQRLGDQDKPATRMLFGMLCLRDPDTPPCV